MIWISSKKHFSNCYFFVSVFRWSK